MKGTLMTTQDTSSNGFGRLNIKTDATGRMIKDPPKPQQKPTRKTRHEEDYLEHYNYSDDIKYTDEVMVGLRNEFIYNRKKKYLY